MDERDIYFVYFVVCISLAYQMQVCLIDLELYFNIPSLSHGCSSITFHVGSPQIESTDRESRSPSSLPPLLNSAACSWGLATSKCIEPIVGICVISSLFALFLSQDYPGCAIIASHPQIKQTSGRKRNYLARLHKYLDRGVINITYVCTKVFA